MTRNEIAQIFAEDKGWEISRAESAVKNRTKAFTTWLAIHPEYKVDGLGRGSRGLDNVELGAGVDEVIQNNWDSIQDIQREIRISITNDPANLKTLTGALKDLQAAYIQMSEIKQRNEDRKGQVIRRDYVEGIVSEVFPKLKVALDEMRTNIKQLLPPEMRAHFEDAYRKSINAYTELLQGAVESLNTYLK